MTTVAPRPELPPMPERIARLPLDARGYPVPFFVAVIDGVPDHRVVDSAKWLRAWKENLCWVCGGRLGSRVAFMIGPMCAVNRTSSELPSHRECAEWSARGCPFLSRSHAHRRTAGMSEQVQPAAGIPLARNPGVILEWICRATDYRLMPDGQGRPLVHLGGAPIELVTWCDGETPAPIERLIESVRTGLPALIELAEREYALLPLARQLRDAAVRLGFSEHVTRELEKAVLQGT